MLKLRTSIPPVEGTHWSVRGDRHRPLHVGARKDPAGWSRTTREVVIQSALCIGIILASVARVPALVVYFGLAVLALRSPLWCLRALQASAFATLLTGGAGGQFDQTQFGSVDHDGGGAGMLIGRYLVLATGVFTLLNSRMRIEGAAKFWFAFTVFAISLVLNGFYVSYSPTISILKAATLLCGIFIVLQITRFLRGSGEFERVYFCFNIVLFVLSLPLTVLPLGYLVNGRGFQGLLNQPQAMGVAAGIFASYMFVRVVRNPRLNFDMFILLIALLSLALSGARTGAVAFLIAATVGVIRLMATWKISGRVFGVLTFLAAMALAIVVFVPGAIDFLVKFVNKGGGSDLTLGEGWERSRGGLVAYSWLGFQESPIWGWGFGLPWNSNQLVVKYDPIFEIPIGASVEKGMIFSAALEELGVVGSAFAVFFLLWILVWSVKAARPEGTALVFAAIASNLGESTLTSFGGLGALVWIAIGAGMSMPNSPHLPPNGRAMSGLART